MRVFAETSWVNAIGIFRGRAKHASVAAKQDKRASPMHTKQEMSAREKAQFSKIIFCSHNLCREKGFDRSWPLVSTPHHTP